MKIPKFVSAMLIMSLSCSYVAYADDEQTTSALIALYNDSVYVPSQEEMSELQRQLQEYNTAVNRNKQLHEFNSAVDDAEEYKAMLVSEANKQVSLLLSEAAQCSMKINSNIYGDINELISYDAEFKGYIKQANYRMEELNKYSSVTKIVTLDSYLETRRQEIDKLQEELTMPDIQIVDGEFLLGEVYRCKSPANQDYQVTSQWGARISPITGTSLEYHNGIDLYAPEGTDVYAVFNGRVLEAGENWALGNFVRIQHGPGVISIYGHLSSMSVKSGDYVTQYDKIGESGNTGNKTSGAHLHFGLFINGQSVDPNILLKNSGRVVKE